MEPFDVSHPNIGPITHAELELKGIVLEYGANPDTDIDKILVRSGERKIWLHFPPHAARSITAVAPVKSEIEAVVDQHGPAGPHPDLTYELKYLRKESDERAVDLSAIPAPSPRRGIAVEVKGSATQDFQDSPEPHRNFVLSGKLITVPPHVADQLLPLIARAKVIVVRGHMRDTTEGFLSASGKPVIRANSIQIDSITYKVL